MRGSIKLFTWFGIPVHLHWTFALIFVLLFWNTSSEDLDLISVVWLVGAMMALFLCVLLHEYGHALTARRYGVHTQDIILTPIGGIARLERMPEKPIQEFLVAIAGPMVNVVIAILIFSFSWLLFDEDRFRLFEFIARAQITDFLNFFFNPFNQVSDTADSELVTIFQENAIQPEGLVLYLPILTAMNIGLVIFNLIPAFPMDGGRIFRALLAMKAGRVRATRIASILGQVLAVFFVVKGLWSGAFTLALIGFFVFTTARSENNMVQLEDILRRYTARDLVRRQFSRLYANDWMQTAADMFRQGLERNFLIFDLQDRLIGVLEEKEIADAIKQNSLSIEVGQMVHQVQLVHMDESLSYIYYLLRHKGHSMVGVAEQGTLVGVIDEMGLDNFMRLAVRR